ncbi:hypothetical protein [Streptomyces tendae]|uniref:hypothetical protein n=1 Tax=Streptomyces tendae TaxID=1932 RepID=UPI002492134F|nr:hypothetical protein [Streptomyces tendae]
MARNGGEQYAFTYVGGETHRCGGFPARWTRTGSSGPRGGEAGEGERSLLEAVAGVFGVRLPRHVLTQGRLHTFTTHSWTRPPRAGETCAVVSLGTAAAR